MIRILAMTVCCILWGTVLNATTSPDTLVEAVDFHDTDINTVVQTIRRQANIPIWSEISRKESEKLPRVTLVARMLPAREVLRYACIQAGLHFDITDQGAMSVCRKPVMHSRFFTVDIFAKEITPEKLQAFFQTGGADFPEGSKIYYRRNSSTLTVVNTVENLRRAALIVGTGTDKHPTPKLFLDRPATFSISNPMLEKKLAAITIAPLNREDIDIAAVLEYFHRQSIELDPERRGVNFFLMPLPDRFNRILNVNLTAISLKDALSGICAATGLTYHYDDFAIIVAFAPPPSKPPTSQPEEKRHEKDPRRPDPRRQFNTDSFGTGRK